MENLKQKEINKIKATAEELGWSFTVQGSLLIFENYSPHGLNFSVQIIANNARQVVKELEEYCDDYDCSQEAYFWLDNTGHGINGAPYNMQDVYLDMEACLEMMEDLRNEISDCFPEDY